MTEEQPAAIPSPPAEHRAADPVLTARRRHAWAALGLGPLWQPRAGALPGAGERMAVDPAALQGTPAPDGIPDGLPDALGAPDGMADDVPADAQTGTGNVSQAGTGAHQRQAQAGGQDHQGAGPAKGAVPEQTAPASAPVSGPLSGSSSTPHDVTHRQQTPVSGSMSGSSSREAHGNAVGEPDTGHPAWDEDQALASWDTEPWQDDSGLLVQIPVWDDAPPAATGRQTPRTSPVAGSRGSGDASAAAPAGMADADVPRPLTEAERWIQLREDVADCRRCRLSQTRTHTVFGRGTPQQARWLLIGEAPGAEEDRRGEAFVGQAGRLLDTMLDAAGIDPDAEVFIANVLKCRPPGNRNPERDEVAACEPFLHEQIRLVKPDCILLLGRFAAQSVLQSDLQIGRLRNKLHHITLDDRQVPVVVTYHPAYLLRNQQDKLKAWEDLCLALATVTEAAGEPVTIPEPAGRRTTGGRAGSPRRPS